MNKKKRKLSWSKLDYRSWIVCNCGGTDEMGHQPTCPRHPDQYLVAHTGLRCGCECEGVN